MTAFPLLPLLVALNVTPATPALTSSMAQPTAILNRLVAEQQPILKKRAINLALSEGLVAYHLAVATELAEQRRRQLAATPPVVADRQVKPLRRPGLRPFPLSGFLPPLLGEPKGQGGIYGLCLASPAATLYESGSEHTFF